MKPYLWFGVAGVGFSLVAACGSSSDDSSTQGGAGGVTAGATSGGSAGKANNGGASNAGASSSDAGAAGAEAGASNQGGATGNEGGAVGASGDNSVGEGGAAGSPDCLAGNCSTSVVRVPLTGDPLDGYVAPLTVGTQTFHVLVDDGTADLVLAGAACTLCTGVTPRYQPGTSATDLGFATQQILSYGSWKGEAFSDHVTLGLSSTVLALSSLTSQTDGYLPSTNAYQGVLGLGEQPLAAPHDQALISTLVAAGTIADAFSMKLCSTGGNLWLGGYDPDTLTSPFVYTPLVQSDFDAITIDGIKVGDTSISSGTGLDATTVDHATSDLLLPTAVYTQFKNAITAANTASSLGGSFPGWFSDLCYPLDAATLAKWPTITVLVPNSAGGPDLALQIPPSAYLLSDSPGDYCLGVQNYPGTSALLGTPLFLSHVLLVDRQDHRLGIATAECP